MLGYRMATYDISLLHLPANVHNERGANNQNLAPSSLNCRLYAN